jgi:hypothetical protein
MFSERLQLLLSPEQRERLRAEADRRRVSVAALIREAIDEHVGVVARSDRVRAVEEISRMRAPFVPPDELEAVLAETRASP